MRILFVVQRYGPHIAGGAEAHCRAFATRLAARGHAVEVLTSRASSYVDWAADLPAGTTDDHGVAVHRLDGPPRDAHRFGPLTQRVLGGRVRMPRHVELAWLEAQGPVLPGLVPWLGEHGSRFDVIVAFTYLYWPTWATVAAALGRAPVVVHPTAHHEPTLYLGIHRTTFSLPSAFAFSTPEEEALVRRAWGTRRPGEVIGVGVDLPPHAGPGPDADAVAAFRRRHGLGDRPYLVCVGRVDPSKGTPELVADFAAYRRRRFAPPMLVLVGDRAVDLELPDDVVATGVVDDAERDAAVAGAVALVQPSRFESFSMVLTEAWALGRPVIVQGASDVLAGQVRRAGAGLVYRNRPEFDAAVDLLLDEPGLAPRLGASGRRFVETTFAWDVVLRRYEALLAAVAGGAGAGVPSRGAADPLG